jgi:uncharacterized protein (TIGR03437 family)
MKAIYPFNIFAALTVTVAGFTVTNHVRPVAADNLLRFTGPTSSQTLALSADDSLLAVANPDNNSVTLFDLKNGNARLAEVAVGIEPNGVALSPDGTRAYIANTVSGTVTILALDRSASSYASLIALVKVGTEPYGLALTPTGRKLYVANARSNSVSVIDTGSNQVIRTITDVGPEPRGIAITNGGGDDSQETVFVTQFLSLPIESKVDGTDDAKAGHVTLISASSDTVIGQVTLNPIPDTGFKAAGDAIKRIAPPATPTPDDFKFTIGAYPNQLNNIAIRGRFAFVPNTGASPNGPFRFDANTASLLSVIDINARADANKTINMHQAVGKQTNPAKRFITVPWAMAFKHQADEAFVISAASNIVVKLKVDPATGAATVQNDPTDSTRVLEIPTGKNPRGIVITSNDKTVYVMNYVSRDVTAIDLTGSVEKVIATLQSETVPAVGTPADKIHAGKELYFTSIGEFDPPSSGKPAITGRMSNNGWGGCVTCHPFGLTDNVVWIFPSGPKRTIPQHTDFDRTDPSGKTMRPLNWSAERDEEEDFELNIRAVSGGLGLIVRDDGITQETNVANLTPLPNGGRNQLKVRGVPAWDAIRAFIQTIRAPLSPISKTDADVVAGRQVFIESNCQSCHGTAMWTTARVRYAPAPDPSLVSAGQLIAELRSLNTFDPNALNEVRSAAAPPPVGADGFTPPSLLSISAFPQTFFHNGSASSLDELLLNVTHRSSGTNGVDKLTDPKKRAQLVRFLLSIDAASEPIAPDAVGDLKVLGAAGYGPAIALDGAAASFGANLARQTLSSPSATLPSVLDGSTVSLQDSAGVLRLAKLYFVSPGQVNFLAPATAATGLAKVTVQTRTGASFAGTVPLVNVAPGIFTVNGAGTGVAAATALRLAADGSQTPVQVFQCTAGACGAVPINLQAGGDVFVAFYGTGIRKRSSLDNVKGSIGGVDVPVAFAGVQPEFPGLDQINVQLPASLRGRGEVTVVFTIDNFTTNPVTINVQ